MGDAGDRDRDHRGHDAERGGDDLSAGPLAIGEEWAGERVREGPAGDNSASLDGAELTEAGERSIAEAEDRESSVDVEEWHPNREQSEFDDMQEWEPAEVESGNDTARAGRGAGAVGRPGRPNPGFAPLNSAGL